MSDKRRRESRFHQGLSCDPRFIFLLKFFRITISDFGYRAMKFARYVFYAAGIYGILVLAPQYFLESKIGLDYPPAITHPEYFYGFTGVALAFQLVFLIIARDPVRYRAMIIPSIAEKFSFAAAAAVLYLQDRLPAAMLFAGLIDLAFGLLFIASYILLSKPNKPR